MSDLSVVNGVQMSYDEKTGITHFEPVKEEKRPMRKHEEEKSWLQQLADWYDGLFIKPYVKCKDLNNGEDTNYENTSHTAVEVGIKIDF